jgi:ectoine hydroxylase-related dioxygenase (phytanoyl-CoA dioxygenase family)
VAIQAIAFDKTDSANWKVAWHQDLMFPFARPVRSRAYALPCVKDGVDYARPPRAVLEKLLAVRLHLDDCDETNGPLRVSPASHLSGVIPTAEIAARVAVHGEVVCLAKEGQALLMKPLLLHASSRASLPKHRRVLHLVFSDGEIDETWHRSVSNETLPSSASLAK